MLLKLWKSPKITKESFLTVRPVFSTEDFREKSNKTNAFQKNNILLSDKATINAKTTIRDFLLMM
jgi:hypothetical protein